MCKNGTPTHSPKKIFAVHLSLLPPTWTFARRSAKIELSPFLTPGFGDLSLPPPPPSFRRPYGTDKPNQRGAKEEEERVARWNYPGEGAAAMHLEVPRRYPRYQTFANGRLQPRLECDLHPGSNSGINCKLYPKEGESQSDFFSGRKREITLDPARPVRPRRINVKKGKGAIDYVVVEGIEMAHAPLLSFPSGTLTTAIQRRHFPSMCVWTYYAYIRHCGPERADG